MNLEAVALAADSAVTASSGDNQKIFGSQNKLFALSDMAPVGILVFGSAAFMSIPWEVIIKEYRRRYGDRVFPTLDEHVAHFFEFFTTDICSSVSTDHQAEYTESLIRFVYEDIREIMNIKIPAEIGQILASEGEISSRQLRDLEDRITTDIIGEYCERAEGISYVEGVPEDFSKRVQIIVDTRCPALIGEIFQFEFKPESVRQLHEIAGKAVGAMVDDLVAQPTGITTGIAIAGFGQADLFPSYSQFDVEGIVSGVLKGRTAGKAAMGPDSRAFIVPLAQSDMIHQFMRGIEPSYRDYLHQSIMSHLSEYTELLVENLERYSETERQALLQVSEEVYPEIAESFIEQVDEIGITHHANDIVNVVAMLPKQELAEMAEALVSLTSLKRRVSSGDETVGGPTDVALITKGDGMVWVKRKHYFPARLNHAFFARKYGIGGIDHGREDDEA